MAEGKGNGNGKEQSSRVIRPDGMPSDAEVISVKLHAIEIPLPSKNPEDLARLCLREVQIPHPSTGIPITTVQLAMMADTALLLLETHLALKKRDEKIAAQETCIEALEERIAELERRFDDPVERDKKEGYDGVG